MVTSTADAPIRVRRETRSRITAAKVYPRETLDDVLVRLLDDYEAREQRKDTRRDSRAS